MDNLDGVWEESGDGVEGFDRAFGAAGEIKNERGAANGGDAAGQDGAWSVLKALATHLFGHAGDEFRGDGLGGFRRGIARAESGAAGGENYIDGISVGELAEEGLDLRGLVGEKMG